MKSSNARNRTTMQAWRSALRFVKRKGYQREIKQISEASPPRNGNEFLEQYAWVVFVAGFDELLLERKWSAMKKAFYEYDPQPYEVG